MQAKERKAVALAEFRFGLIAPAVNGTYPDATMAAYFRRVAAGPVPGPDGIDVMVRASTLKSWRRRYLEGGFAALMPKERSDLGTSRRIDADLAADIQAMRAEHPRMAAATMRRKLIEGGYIAEGEMSDATLQRFFRANPIAGGGDACCKDRRAFEAARVNGIWQADSLHGPYVGQPPRKAYLQMIVDDKSRKVVAARFVEHDDAAAFQALLKGAVASHGIPERLFVDNGGPYKNAQLSLICGGLGIALCHAAVRDGAAKGKIERLNRTLRMTLLNCLDPADRESLGALNAALGRWASSYNARVHSSTRKAPADAFSAEGGSIRWFEGDEEALRRAFMNRITRKVAKDATVRIEHVLFDAPMGLIGEKVEILYTPGDADDVWVSMPDGLRRIAATDKAANAEAGRVRPAYEVDYGREGGLS